MCPPGSKAWTTCQSTGSEFPKTISPQPHLHSVSKLLIETVQSFVTSHTLPTQVYRGSFLLWDPKNDAHFGKTSIFDDKCVLLVKLVHWKIKSSKNEISDLKIQMSNTNNSFPAKLDLSIFVREFVRDVNPKQSSILHPPFEPLGAQAGKLQWHALPGTRSVYRRYFSSNHLTWMWEGQPHMTGGLLIKRPSWLSCMKNCSSVQAFQPILQEPAETPGKCKPKPVPPNAEAEEEAYTWWVVMQYGLR